MTNALPNTAVLCFVIGWQGGTVHQVAKELNTTTQDIMHANYDRMGELCRIAQARRRKTHDELINALKNLINWIDGPEAPSLLSEHIGNARVALEKAEVK